MVILYQKILQSYKVHMLGIWSLKRSWKLCRNEMIVHILECHKERVSFKFERSNYHPLDSYKIVEMDLYLTLIKEAETK